MSLAHHRKAFFFMALGLCFLFFLIGMAFLAAKSDKENQRQYKLQHEEIAKKYNQSGTE
ncbi:hypothetical protein [Acinetobacter guerrae]|uniref:hypothetical protein n=1 Tax=Acinetobacter guerrae TaxID=1843371 RepID=UPI00148EF8ED|nr:hypothetical protein [Acinetobacter guerrae]